MHHSFHCNATMPATSAHTLLAALPSSHSAACSPSGSLRDICFGCMAGLAVRGRGSHRRLQVLPRLAWAVDAVQRARSMLPHTTLYAFPVANGRSA